MEKKETIVNWLDGKPFVLSDYDKETLWIIDNFKCLISLLVSDLKTIYNDVKKSLD